MNANQMTFGIEIETTIAVNTLVVGPHGRGYAIPQIPGWKADNDPSISAGYGRMACEFVSPIYTGSEGLAALLSDIAKIKSLGAQVNASCGLHIHVGFDRNNAMAVERLTTIVSNFETAIYASTGTKNRERGRWCNSIRRHGDAQRAIHNASSYRYHVVNLGSEHPTVEFRPFAASLKPSKIAGYICLCLGIVEKALLSKRDSSWAPKPTAATSPIHRNGEGQTQLTRFFYAMGWTKGRVDYTFGNVLGNRPIKPIKRELMKMAAKYDSQQ